MHQLNLPQLENEQYHSMPGHKLDDLFRKASKENSNWFNKRFNPKTTWAYVTQGGDVWGEGIGNTAPTAYQTRIAAQMVTTPLFLLTRPEGKYLDTAFFLLKSNMLEMPDQHVYKAFERPMEDFHNYGAVQDGFLTINAQSGITNNLRRAGYAVGRLAILHPQINQGDETDRTMYSFGVTVANVSHAGSKIDRQVHISSKNRDVSIANGNLTDDMRTGHLRFERLGTFDDGIIDTLNSWEYYRRKIGEKLGLHPLILHGKRSEFDKQLDRAFWPNHANHYPRQEPKSP